jgi:hypothetical protein
MKDHRDEFDKLPMDQIKHYCNLELVFLSKALTVLRDGFDKMGIRLRTWGGADAAAAALIRKEKLKINHYSPVVKTSMRDGRWIAHRANDAGLVEERSEGVRHIYSLRCEGLMELRDWLDSFWSDALLRRSKPKRKKPEDKTNDHDKRDRARAQRHPRESTDGSCIRSLNVRPHPLVAGKSRRRQEADRGGSVWSHGSHAGWRSPKMAHRQWSRRSRIESRHIAS